jgi:hypothetical protein
VCKNNIRPLFCIDDDTPVKISYTINLHKDCRMEISIDDTPYTELSKKINKRVSIDLDVYDNNVYVLSQQNSNVPKQKVLNKSYKVRATSHYVTKYDIFNCNVYEEHCIDKLSDKPRNIIVCKGLICIGYWSGECAIYDAQTFKRIQHGSPPYGYHIYFRHKDDLYAFNPSKNYMIKYNFETNEWKTHYSEMSQS